MTKFLAIVIEIAVFSLTDANILRIFQVDPPVPKFGYTPQFLQHNDAGEYHTTETQIYLAQIPYDIHFDCSASCDSLACR